MVSKTFIPIAPTGSDKKNKKNAGLVPVVTAVVSTVQHKTESVSTMGTNGITTARSDQAMVKSVGNPSFELLPHRESPRSGVKITPLGQSHYGDNHPNGTTMKAHLQQPDKARAPRNTAGFSSTVPSIEHTPTSIGKQTAPMKARPSSYPSKICKANKKSKRAKRKELRRDPQLQAALDRIQWRQQADAVSQLPQGGRPGPPTSMETTFHQQLLPQNASLVQQSLHYPSFYRQPSHLHSHSYYPSSMVDSRSPEPSYGRDPHEMVNIFSEYETILDRLMRKHAMLQNYVDLEEKPHSYDPYKVHSRESPTNSRSRVRERIERLRIERRGKEGVPAGKNTSRSGGNAAIREHITTTNKQSQDSTNKYGREEGDADRKKRESEHPTGLEKLPKAAGRVRYGRNQGFIHSSQQLQYRLSELIPASSEIGHHKDSHLFTKSNEGETEDSKEKTQTSVVGKFPIYEKPSKIKKLRDELAQLRERQKTSPTITPHAVNEEIPNADITKKSDRTTMDPLPTLPVSQFNGPISPSTVDPAGERYNPLTTANCVQPSCGRSGPRVDAPGPRIHDMRQDANSTSITSRPSVKLRASNFPPQPAMQLTSDDLKVPRSASIQRRDDQIDQDETTQPIRMKRQLSTDRRRIEEIEKRVMASKSNQLDEDLEREILKMSPLISEFHRSFPQSERTADSLAEYENSDGSSVGSDHDTDSSDEIVRPEGRKIHVRSNLRSANGALISSKPKIREQERRSEIVRRLLRARETTISRKTDSMEPSRKLSQLMPERSKYANGDSLPSAPTSSSVTSTENDDTDDEPEHHFLPVSSSNRGRWLPHVTVRPEEETQENIFTSFSNGAMTFLANTFSLEIEAAESPDNISELGIEVSFETMNKKAHASRMYDSDTQDQYDASLDEKSTTEPEIQMVESEDGIVYVQLEDENPSRENSWESDDVQPEYEDRVSSFLPTTWNDPGVEFNRKTATKVWETAGEHMNRHQEHFLKPSSSYKDPKARTYEFETVPVESTVGNKTPPDSFSSANETDRYATESLQSEISEQTEQEERNLKLVVADSPTRRLLRELSGSLLSVDSSCNSNSKSNSTPSIDNVNETNDPNKTILDLLSDSSDEKVKFRPTPETSHLVLSPPRVRKRTTRKRRKDIPNLSPVHQSSPTTTPSQKQPIQKKDQQDPPTSSSQCRDDDRLVEAAPSPVLNSPKGSAIESTKYADNNFWTNPFNF